MGYLVLPASIPEIRHVYDVYFAAFDGELVTQILFPWNIHDEEFRKGHATHTLEYWHKQTTQYTYKCIDTDTGSIVGMVLFDVFAKSLTPEERQLPAVDWLQGTQKERAEAFIRSFWERKEEILEGKAHICKSAACVHMDWMLNSSQIAMLLLCILIIGAGVSVVF